MEYLPDIENVIGRYRRFHASQEPGGLLIHVFTPAVDPKGCDLRDYRFPDPVENERYQEAFIAMRERYLRSRIGLRDDYVPDIYIDHGIGLHSAYVAGDIVFGENTSWSHPVIQTWDDLDNLRLSTDNRWFQMLRQSAQILADRTRGKMGIATFYHFSPLDMANALRGNQIFLDFCESPAELSRLLDFCTEAIIWLEKQIWPIVGDLHGGAPLWGSWLPGHAIMMSEDAANLCRPDDYPSWAAPWTQRVIDAFDGAFIHNHALGIRSQGEIAKLRGLRVLQISEDPNQPRPIDHLAHLIETTHGMALQVGCRPEEIKQVVEVARRGRVILQTSAPDVTTANEIVDYVRSKSSLTD